MHIMYIVELKHSLKIYNSVVFLADTALDFIPQYQQHIITMWSRL